MLRPGNRSASTQSFWTGEFRDPAAEDSYRLASHPLQRGHLSVLAVMIMAISWPMIFADHMMIQGGDHAFYVFLARLACASIPLSWIIAYRRGASYRTLDLLLVIYAIYVALDMAVLIDLFHADLGIMAARAPLFVMIGNVMLPLGARHRIALNVIGAILICGALWLSADSADETLASLAIIQISAHIFGFAAGTRLAHLRRAEFVRSTELEQANKALVETNRQMEEVNATKSLFMSNVSHELRTPLNAIIGFSEMLQLRIFGPLGDKRYDGYAKDIAHSGRLLRDLIDDLLDLDKVEAGKMEMKPEWTEVAGAADEWLKMVRMAARPQGADRIKADALPRVEMFVDRRAFQQIIVNLLNNALKYAGDGAMITLTGKTDGQGRLCIGVVDSGIGMNAETVERLLRPFEQADSQVARKAEGWGLGLPLANALAKANSATLSIESTWGLGTSAMIVVPPALVRPVDRADAA